MVAWPMLTDERQSSIGEEIRGLASFARWPLIGLAGAVVAGRYQFEWSFPAGSGWTFLPLLARWSNLDQTFNDRLIR